MEQNNHRESNSFFSGFLLGAIFGGLLVFLLATEKGKKILKILKEEGLGQMSQLEELFDEEMEGEDIPPEKVSNSSDTVGNQSANGEIKSSPASSPKESFVQKTKSTGKRFFKGIQRKK